MKVRQHSLSMIVLCLTAGLAVTNTLVGEEIVLDADSITAMSNTGITIVDEPEASIGKAIRIHDGASAACEAQPTVFLEMEFKATAETYYIWLRGKGLTDGTSSDAVWMQFDDEIGTDKISVGDEFGVGNWLDTFPRDTYGWASNEVTLLPETYTFATAGKHKIRLQPRQVPHIIDQIWFSTTQTQRPADANPVERPEPKSVSAAGKLITLWGQIRSQRR